MRAACLVLLVASTACAAAPRVSDKPRVVAAFYPLEEVARHIGGDAVAVTNLTPPGGEPHDLELRPSDVRAVNDAGLILYVGGGFQPALERAIAATSNRARVVDVLSGVPTLGARDPHVWLSPPLMEQIVETVTRALTRLVPSRAADFERRRAALQSELEALDADYRNELAHCARHEIFTPHAAFGFLASRYGLTQVALSGVSPEAEPTSGRLQAIADRARSANASTIFFEPLVGSRVAETIARLVGAHTAALDPIESLTPKQRSAGAGYVSLMRSNLRALAAALGCTP